MWRHLKGFVEQMWSERLFAVTLRVDEAGGAGRRGAVPAVHLNTQHGHNTPASPAPVTHYHRLHVQEPTCMLES